MEGINGMRMVVSLVLEAIFEVVYAYGTSTVEIEGFTEARFYHATIFSTRLHMGLMIGLAGGVLFLKGYHTSKELCESALILPGLPPRCSGLT
jgi:hypothetical protein